MNFEKEILTLEEKIKVLRSDNRTDDARLEQIKLGVYKHVIEIKNYTDQMEKDLTNQLLEIKGHWLESLKKAEMYDDLDNLIAEKTKIDTLDKILEVINV